MNQGLAGRLSADPTSELLLLGMLERQSMHAYAISEFLEGDLQFVTDMNRTTAYRLLERMRAAGLVEAMVERVGRRPERTVYRLTPAGRARFHSLLEASIAAQPRFVHPDNVALLFSDRLETAARERLFAQRQTQVQELRGRLEALAQEHSAGSSGREVLDLQIGYVDAELHWLQGAAGRITTADDAATVVEDTA